MLVRHLENGDIVMQVFFILLRDLFPGGPFQEGERLYGDASEDRFSAS